MGWGRRQAGQGKQNPRNGGVWGRPFMILNGINEIFISKRRRSTLN